MDSDFSVLGHTGVRVASRLDVEWGTPKARAMLAVLLVHHHRWITIERLFDWMWTEEDDPPANLTTTFYGYANKVKAVLRRAGSDHLFHSRRGAYRMDAGPSSVDYFRARDELARARHATDPREALTAARRVVDLWVDEPLADVRGKPAEHWRATARDRVLIPAHLLIGEKHLALGQPGAALAALEDVPEAESGASLMLSMLRLEALHGAGRSAEVSDYLAKSCARLAEELGEGAARTLQQFYEGLRARRGKPSAPRPEPLDSAKPQQLPPPVPDFTGRDALLAKLTAVAIGQGARPRPCVIVLDGQGGVGKTQLAVQWGRRCAHHFPDGRLYVDLNGFSDGPSVTHAVVVDRFLEALGQAPDRFPEPDRRAARLQAVLNERQVLVVLDNAVDTEHVRPLLPLLVSCVVLVTSRNQLTDLAMTYGSQHFHVGPLTGQHGKEFLAACIGERSREEGAPLEELVELCGGLPIALRLLANYVNARPAVSLREFARRLRDDSGVLDLGGSGGGLSAVFSWSYLALTAEQARAFRLVGLHPGAEITAAAAAALVGGDHRGARKVLDALVDVNLLEQPVALDRYRFHDLMRSYAVQCLADEPEPEVTLAETRMFDFYLHTAKNADDVLFPARLGYDELGEPVTGANPLVFTDSESAMRWCVRERDTVTAVIGYAASRGRHDVAAALPQMVGELLTRYGMHTSVLANLALALESSIATGAAEHEGYTLHNMGHVHLIRQEYGLAEDYFTRAYRKFLELRHEVGMAVALHSGARVLVELGNVVMGIDSHTRALRMIRKTGNRAMEAAFLGRIGEAYRKALDFDQAAVYYRESLELAEALGDLRARGVALVELAALYYERGNALAAREHCDRMLATAEQTHDLLTAGRACNVLAAVEFDAGHAFEAKQYARKAAQLCRRVCDGRGEATALDVLARLLRKAARYEGAREAWERARTIFRDLAMITQAEEVERDLAELDGRAADAVPEARAGSALLAWRGRALS